LPEACRGHLERENRKGLRLRAGHHVPAPLREVCGGAAACLSLWKPMRSYLLRLECCEFNISLTISCWALCILMQFTKRDVRKPLAVPLTRYGGLPRPKVPTGNFQVRECCPGPTICLRWTPENSHLISHLGGGYLFQVLPRLAIRGWPFLYVWAGLCAVVPGVFQVHALQPTSDGIPSTYSP
jgi:hypothetical protein